MGGLNVRFPFQKAWLSGSILVVGSYTPLVVTHHTATTDQANTDTKNNSKSGHSTHLLFKIWSQTIQKQMQSKKAEDNHTMWQYWKHSTKVYVHSMSQSCPKSTLVILCRPVFHRKCHGQIWTPLMICCTGGWPYHVILLIEKKIRV